MGEIDLRAARGPRRILVVDDSITVRELERQLLESHGYFVEVAVDGVDGWNAVRSGEYHLVISDVGAHKLWIARMFPALEPNSVIISNGFAAMGAVLSTVFFVVLVLPPLVLGIINRLLVVAAVLLVLICMYSIL